ncbi:MAG: dihydropteroate synthase [Leptospirillum sp.]
MPRPDLANLIRLARSHYKGPLIMGVINVTPDSFSGTSGDITPLAVWEKASRFLDQGADILDIGAESTRPGFTPVSPEEERNRLLPVLEKIASLPIVLSIDTRSPAIFRETMAYGASLINDVGMLRDKGFVDLLKEFPSLMAVLMHSPGPSLHTPSMSESRNNLSIGESVRASLMARMQSLLGEGIDAERLILDPGLGFGKDTILNLELLRSIKVWSGGLPVLVGASRKRFIGEISGESDPLEREAGTISIQNWCHLEKVTVIRTHDVASARQARQVFHALLSER